MVGSRSVWYLPGARVTARQNARRRAASNSSRASMWFISESNFVLSPSRAATGACISHECINGAFGEIFVQRLPTEKEPVVDGSKQKLISDLNVGVAPDIPSLDPTLQDPRQFLYPLGNHTLAERVGE